MSTFLKFLPYIQIVFLLVLGGALIWRKRTGRWKRPWSFRMAMGLLGLSIALLVLAQVLRYFGM